MRRAAVAVGMICLVLAACGRSGGESPSELGGGEASWIPHLRAMDDALAQKNVGAVERAWHRAYTAALGSRGWEGMVAVGDAALRIGNVTGFRKPYEAKARELYLAALFRARAERSVEGVLRVAEAFQRLGDNEVVTQCLAIARGVAAQLPQREARERAATLVEQFSARVRGVHRAEDVLF